MIKPTGTGPPVGFHLYKGQIMSILHKIDTFLIEQLDKITTKAQRKGLVPMNTMVMFNEILFWGCFIINRNFKNLEPFDYVILILTPLALYFAYDKWQDAVGYWENHRKTLHLNSLVQLERENCKLRILVVFTFVPIMLIHLVFGLYIMDLNALALITLGYIKCCRYMGPGEYSRQRKEKLQGLPELG
jgi:hypothetical protein